MGTQPSHFPRGSASPRPTFDFTVKLFYLPRCMSPSLYCFSVPASIYAQVTGFFDGSFSARIIPSHRSLFSTTPKSLRIPVLFVRFCYVTHCSTLASQSASSRVYGTKMPSFAIIYHSSKSGVVFPESLPSLSCRVRLMTVGHDVSRQPGTARFARLP